MKNVIPIGLPHYHEAEVTVIGTILNTPSCVHGHSEKLRPEYFFEPKHQIIIAAIQDLVATNTAPDLIAVYGQLRSKGDNLKMGDLDGLRSFFEYNSRPEFLGHWLAEIRKYWSLRLIIETCSLIASKGRNVVGADVDNFLAYAESKFFEIAESRIQKGLTPVSQIATETFKELEVLMQKKKTDNNLISGIPSGLRDLDVITGGFQRSDLIILAARPAMGKTSLALNIACEAVFNNDKYVAFFSLEMTNTQLMQRMVASLAKIDATKFRTGDMQTEDIDKLYPLLGKFQTNCMLFDDSAAITIIDIGSRCRKMKREKGALDLIIVDYLQLITAQPTGNRQQNREREISVISMGLKNLAKEMNCPLIALSQLNRNLEMRQDKRPFPADLRDSGSIEQDSDLILFVYRDEVYNKNSNDTGIAEIIIGKNRHGETATIRTAFMSKYTSFHNLAKPYL